MVNAKLQWDTRLLGQLIQSIDTGTSVRSRSSNSSYPAVLKTSALSFGRFDASERKAILSEDLDRRKCEIFAGDILISRMNTPDRVGAAVFVESTPPNIFLPDRIWRVTTTTQADARWLCYALNFPPMSARIRGLGSGTSGSMKNIPKAKLLGVEVPFPPLSQQRAIADVLAGFDEHLANLDALIAKKKAVRDGALEELIFPVQLPRSQDTRDQAEVRLGELVYELSDAIHPGSRPSENFVEYSMPSYDQGQHATTVAGSSMLSARREIHTPCVLVNKLNVRKQRIWMIQEPEPNAVCSFEFVPLASNELDLAYLKYLALGRKFTEYLEANTTGTSNSQKRVTASTILAFKFNVPSTQKQREIGATLSSMDAEIAALVEERAKVERLKQGAMEDLLTGRVRLLVHEEAS